MGQSVSQQLGVGVLGAGVDPDYLRSQILQQREKQYAAITNPQQQLAARLGGLLGGGLSNISQDKGFFDINDPLLNKVSQIQGIYNDVSGRVDPAADPAKFFSELQKAYADAGLGQQALMAAQEAQKAKTAGMDVQIKEAQLYKASPELLAGKIEDALKSGNEPEAIRLANLKTRIDQDRELELQAKRTNILKDEADIKYKKFLSEDGKYKVSWNEQLQRYVRTDRNGNVEIAPMNIELEKALGVGAPSKPAAKDGAKGEKRPLSGFYGDVQVPPTDGKPRARGKMEQAELDALAERQRQKDLADKPRQDALAQGRDYWNTVQQRAQANGLVPQSTGYFGQMVYVDPRTGMQYTADQLFNVGE